MFTRANYQDTKELNQNEKKLLNKQQIPRTGWKISIKNLNIELIDKNQLKVNYIKE